MKATRLGRVICLFALFTCVITCQSAAPEVAWVRKWGGDGDDMARSVAVDNQGRTYVCGTFDTSIQIGKKVITSFGTRDAFLASFSEAGDLRWLLPFGGKQFDFGDSVALDKAGNCCVVGIFNGTAQFGKYSLKSQGALDVFVAKVDPAGEVLWVRSMGGPTNDYARAVAVDSSGHIYIGGYFRGTATFGKDRLTADGQSEMFVIKMDPEGEFVWARQYGGQDGNILAGLAVDERGQVSLCGHFWGTTRIGKTTLTSRGGSDGVVARLDSQGEPLWAVSLGGPATGELMDEVTSIALDAEGNICLAGQFASTAKFGDFELQSAGKTDAFIARMTPDGRFLWARSAGGPEHDRAYRVGADATGHIYVTGGFIGTASFGPSSFTARISDIFISKLDRDGNFLWTITPEGAGFDRGLGLAFDQKGAVYVCGDYQGPGRFGNVVMEGPPVEPVVADNLPLPILAAQLSAQTAKQRVDAFLVKIAPESTQPVQQK